MGKYRPIVGRSYIYDFPISIAFDVWGRPVALRGRHKMVKVRDSLMDKIRGRSWYEVDERLLLRIAKGVEKHCVREDV